MVVVVVVSVVVVVVVTFPSTHSTHSTLPGFLFGWCGARDVQRGLVYGCACGGAAVGQVGVPSRCRVIA